MAKYNPSDIINIRPRKYGFVLTYRPKDRIDIMLLSVKLVVRKKYSEYICQCLNLHDGTRFHMTIDSRDDEIIKVEQANVAI